MKLIDNRYKVDRILEDNLYSSVFEVIDFWNNDRKLYMKLYNVDKQNDVIDCFINNFILLSKIKHKFLLTSDRFNIINTIDRKKLSIKQYYSTSEYIDSPSLDKSSHKLGFKEKLNIILQICTVLDFLHYRGVVYKHLSPSNIFLLEDESIKIKDLATIYERVINTDYDDLTRYFIAPEVILGHEEVVNKNADKYSLGMLMIYLLTEDFYRSDNREFNYIYKEKLNDSQIAFLDRIINILIRKNPVTRDCTLKEIIENIINLFNMDYKRDLVEERGSLNFDTKIIGREKEIERILKIDDEFIIDKGYRRAILINGGTGVGKTRLLKEITHILKMRGRDVYYTEITEQDNIDIKPITNILRQTIKDVPKGILEKYGKELIKVLPELKFLLDIDSFNDLGGERERLRLYDRITNYLEEISKDKPIYLIIDNIENCNAQFLFLLDYIINNISKGNIILIISFNEKMILEEAIEKSFFKRWRAQKDIEEIAVTNLDLSEIGEFIQNILGMSYKPLKFSAVMLKETQGNPRYIEYMMKDLYLTGELFLHPEGFWEIKTQRYTDIYFSSSIDEAMKNQLNLIKDEYKDIMEVISIYNDSMSKKTLLKILDIDIEDLNKKLDNLISMRLLDERVADWGYSYNINSVQLKKLIYHQIPQEKRVELHKEMAQLLEDTYMDNYRGILDELIYHLISSNQLDKALDYIVKEAKKDENIFSFQSMVLWQESYELAKDCESEHKLEILENLGKIHFLKGENDKALEIYGELFSEGERLGEREYTIAANIGIGEIYLKKSLTDLSLKEAKRAMETSRELGCLDGFFESQILYNKILLNDGKIEEVEKNMEKLLELALEYELNRHLGNIYNIMGLIEYYRGNVGNAILKYEESIEAFHEIGEFIDSTKPINNTANIYSQHGEFDKAMKYYEKGLGIVEKYDVLNVKLVFLNNIGSAYLNLYDYDKAKKYIEEARITAIEVEDTNMVFMTHINLGLIYLLTGDYEQSYNFYIILKEIYVNTQAFNFEVISFYYNYLGEFYYIFGNWDEALKYSQKAMDDYKEFSNIEYLMIKTRIVLIEYFKDGLYNKKYIEGIRAEIRSMNLYFHRRKVLLDLAIIPFLERDYEYVLDILKEDSELEKDYFVPSFNYIRKILLYGIRQYGYGYEDKIILEEDMKKYNLHFIDIFANKLLGFKYFEDGKYYQAINYLLEALDIIYRLIRNIPNRDMQISYIKSRKGDIIKLKLSEVIYEAFGKKLDYLCIDDLNSNDNIEKYFNYKSLLRLMNDDEFIKITETSYLYEGTEGINSIETLIQNLTGNYEFNLKLILKYLAKETFAQRGYILLYDEKNNKYLPITTLNGDVEWLPNENLLALANRYERGILINDNLGENIIGLHREFLPRDTRALICIPITVSRMNNIHMKKERRKSKVVNVQRNEGYIYLETDRIFNRFDETRYMLSSSLSQIVYMNIENYKLKILSTIDKLTGTYTRKHFENELNKILNEAKRSGECFALLMVDIDRFKNINDTYGHRKGDEVLSKIGYCLLSSIRTTDIIGRYGGDEFIIILKNVEEEDAVKIAEKIKKNIDKISISKLEDPITISVGISMFPKHSQFKEELVEKADQALYRAKEKGKDMMVWDTHLSNTINRVDKLAGILSGSINQDQRHVLSILDVIDLVKESGEKSEKIYKFLGRLIETLEAESSALIELDYEKTSNTYARSRLTQQWVDDFSINYDIVKRVMDNKKGEYLIDWESVKEVDVLLNTPNWKSVMAIPLVTNGKLNGVVYVTVPIKEKEFDYNSYNLAKTLCGIFSTVI